MTCHHCAPKCAAHTQDGEAECGMKPRPLHLERALRLIASMRREARYWRNLGGYSAIEADYVRMAKRIYREIVKGK